MTDVTDRAMTTTEELYKKFYHDASTAISRAEDSARNGYHYRDTLTGGIATKLAVRYADGVDAGMEIAVTWIKNHYRECFALKKPIADVVREMQSKANQRIDEINEYELD